MPTPRESKGGASSWGPTPTGEVQGLGIEQLLQSSRQLREYIHSQIRDQSGLQHVNVPFTNQPAGEALATAVDVINPLPGGKLDAILAVVPFGKVMDEVLSNANRLFHNVPKGGVKKYINEYITPRLMRMTVKANKAGVDHMDMPEQAHWLRENILRGVRDKTGKIHWSEPGEEILHYEMVDRLLDRGIEVDDEDVANFLFKWDNEVVSYSDGGNLENAFNSYFMAEYPNRR